MTDTILESINKCKTLEGAIIKVGKTKYEVIEYDHFLGYILRKVSGKKSSSVFSVSLSVMVSALQSGKAMLIDIPESNE